MRSSMRSLAAVGMLAVTLAVAGCGEDEADTAAAAGGTAGGEAAPAAADVRFEGSLEQQVPEGYEEPERAPRTIGMSLPLRANETVDMIGKGVELEVERLGGRTVGLDAQGNPDKQVSDVEQLVARDVDALVVWPLDVRALGPVLARADDAGIPVIGIEPDLKRTDAPEGFDSQIWERRDYIAYLQAREAARLAPAASFGQIGFAIPVPTLEEQLARQVVWAERFGLELAGRTDNPSDDIAGGETAMTQLLSQHPDIELLLSYNDESAVGAAAAARAQGKRDVLLVGSNGGTLGTDAIENGRLSVTVQVPAPDIGRDTAWGAYGLAAGAEVPPTVITRGEPKVMTRDTRGDVEAWDETLRERYGKTG